MKLDRNRLQHLDALAHRLNQASRVAAERANDLAREIAAKRIELNAATLAVERGRPSGEIEAARLRKQIAALDAQCTAAFAERDAACADWTNAAELHTNCARYVAANFGPMSEEENV